MTPTENRKGNTHAEALDDLLAVGETQARTPIRESRNATVQNPTLESAAIGQAAPENGAAPLPDETDDEAEVAEYACGIADEVPPANEPSIDEWRDIVAAMGGNLPEPEGWESHERARWE